MTLPTMTAPAKTPSPTTPPAPTPLFEMLAVVHLRRLRLDGQDVTLAAAVLDGPNGQSRETFMHAGHTTEARYGAALDAFAHLYRQAQTLAQPLPVHIADSGVRRELAAVEGSFPQVRLVPGARGRFVRLLADASEKLSECVRGEQDSHAEPAAVAPADLPELVVATDASKSRRRGVGIAYVTADGVHGRHYVPEVRSVFAGELLAIERALRRFPGRRLHVLTDSLHAVDLLSPGGAIQADDSEITTIVQRIRHLLLGRTVRFSWVRGHSGHPLNECADRLAVAARRGHEARIDDSVQRDVAASIIAELIGRRVA